MATVPGQEFASWTSIPKLTDAFNQARKGNPSAASMLLGSAILANNPTSDIGKQLSGQAAVPPAVSPVPPTAAPVLQAPQLPTINQLPETTSTQPVIQSTSPLFQSHPILDKIVTGFQSLMP